MFSILTPTYNRVKELSRVYDSLKNQTYTDFEWIISDDGSTDGTAELVQEWQNKENRFKITYHVLTKNQGKSSAVNEGLELCERPYTLIADSDDSFLQNTLSDLATIWKTVELSNNPKKIGAIWSLVMDEKGQLIGEKFPKNLWQVSFNERVLERTNPIKGEKWHCWRTEVLKEFKMFVNPNSFISEGATWDKINSTYDYLCVNSVHRVYWHTTGGLIHQKKSKLSIQKHTYFTSLAHLEKASYSQIVLTQHYRRIAFNYIKAKLSYSNSEYKLDSTKFVWVAIAFIIYLPHKIIHKIIS